MSVATNADDYAAARVGVFFPADGETPNDGDLTGQCVTLLKWFFAEMTAISNPFAARGDARYVGKRLVAQGLADEIPYDQRRRGDVICYEYGTYGHIALQLSGGRVFEENVGIGAAKRVLSDGTVVYASRIGSENETWRHDQHVYRLKTYTEGNMNPNSGDVENIVGELWGRSPNAVDIDGFTKGNWHDFIYGVLGNYPYQDRKKMFAKAVDDVARLTQERDTAAGIAGIRYDLLDRIAKAVGVTHEPDEGKTVDNILAKFKNLEDQHSEALAENLKLQGQITDLQKQVNDLQSGDNIIITRTGFNGLFDVIKQYFAKK